MLFRSVIKLYKLITFAQYFSQFWAQDVRNIPAVNVQCLFILKIKTVFIFLHFCCNLLADML